MFWEQLGWIFTANWVKKALFHTYSSCTSMSGMQREEMPNFQLVVSLSLAEPAPAAL